jgi:RHS repeat-associated protein
VVDGVLDRGWLYLNALEPIAELGPDGAGGTRVTKVFVYGTLPHVPDYMVELDASGDPTRTLRIITDHLGSVRRVIDVATGVVVQGYDYDTFGNPTLVAGTEEVQPFGFAGGLYDAATGLVRFGARDYDAYTGRWTAKDPTRFRGGANLYRYAANNPISYRDSTGAVPETFGEFATTIIGLWYGVIGSGFNFDVTPYWNWDDPYGEPMLVFEFYDNTLGQVGDGRTYSRTIGNVICYASENPSPKTRAHEWAHVQQFAALDGSYIPSHLSQIGYSYATTGSYERNNGLEWGPYSDPSVPWSDGPPASLAP